MTEATLAELLAEYAAATTWDTLPDAVRADIPRRVLDIVGISLAAVPLETSQAAIGFVRDQGGNGQAHAIGVPERLPAAWAAFVNGTLAHSLDYDDTHLPSILHPSACVVPAALAAGELAGATGRDLVAAVAVGLEVAVRLGMAAYDDDARDSVFFELGQHATSICGTMGAAVAAAMLLDATASTIRDALGIAASMAAGIIEGNRTGGTVKRLHCGWAAHAGVSAAQLATRGITGPPTVLEGKFGFYAAFVNGRYRPEAITEGLGEQWAAPTIHFKPYPANHFTHTGIDAAVRLRESGLDPRDIREIQLGVAASTVRTIGEPIEVKRAPETGYQAQFSGPYTVAAALLGGSGLALGLDDFTDELARDPERRQLMAKVSVVADEKCTAIYPHEFPAVLVVRTNQGETLTERVLANRGGPQRPLSDEELTRKFTDNATRLLDAERVEHVRDAVLGVADAPDLTSMMGVLTSD